MSDYDEKWAVVPEFPDYMISDHGTVMNSRTGRILKPSVNTHGLLKIKFSDQGVQHTRGLAQLVATEFVQKPDVDPLAGECDSVILLDGDKTNVAAWNLAWRPNHFAWKYTRQMNIDHPHWYYNLEVENTTAGCAYPSIVEAGMAEGMLFDDIWRSTFTGSLVFPTSARFVVLE